MIVMKSVTGPLGYDTAAGFNIVIGELEEIHVTSGKMVAAKVASSSELYPIVTSVSGNIATLEMFFIGSGMTWSSASSVLTSVELVIIADGY